MKTFFASLLGTFVGIILIIIAGFALLVGLGSKKAPKVEDHSVLMLKLNPRITELEIDPGISALFPGSEEMTIGLAQLRTVMRRAKDDDQIEGVYLNASTVAAGFATLDEIRKIIYDFKSSGKWVIAYSDSYSEGAYYVASAADQVYMNPTGQVELNGLSFEVMYYKDLFDKLDIKPQVFRVGDFKSAVEPFMRNTMSDENRLQLTELVNNVYSNMLAGLSESRNIPVDRLKEISSKMLVRNSKQAVEAGLLDSLLYDDEVKALLREKLGLEEDASIPFVKYFDYQRAKPELKLTPENEIAVIVADGEILPGSARQDVVGSTTIREQIRRARTNDRVKAIVIRVNSPGGSFTASDEMWREVYLASQEKPVIGSMGDYAASGGYYLSMACDTIVAQPNTITGSIGVFSVLFDLSGFLGNKLGVRTEQVQTGEVGDLVTMARPLTTYEKDIWQKQTDEIYDIFVKKAGEGRGRTEDEIRKVASGRVWTGQQALEHGLVDKLGSFDDAIDIAAAAAGVSDKYSVRFYPEPKPFFEQLLSNYEDEVRTSTIQQEAGEYYFWFRQWERIRNYEGTQARMPVEFKIN